MAYFGLELYSVCLSRAYSHRAVLQIKKSVCKQYISDVVLVLCSALWSTSTECVCSQLYRIYIYIYRPPQTGLPCRCCSALCKLSEVHHQHYYLVSCCQVYSWIILRMDSFFLLLHLSLCLINVLSSPLMPSLFTISRSLPSWQYLPPF